MIPLSIIIACYNEQETIESCLTRVVAAAPLAEIIVVHGGTDDTAFIADQIAKAHPQITVIRNSQDKGKGDAVKVGISAARSDVMVQFDADLQFMPEEILKVVDPLIKKEADVSLGCRFMKGSNVENYDFSILRTVGNKIINLYFSILLGRCYHDVTTGFKAWTREAITLIDFKDNRFVYEAEIAIRGAMKGFRYAMIPISYSNRAGGISGHGDGLKETWSVVSTGFKLLFFGTCIRFRLW